MSYDRPFAGLKVVDISQGIAGPYAAMMLAQYGADVVKVEPPEGDWARSLGQRYGDHTAFSIAGNLGKRAIAIDLKAPEGRDIVGRLADEADVFLEGFRPGVTKRLGLGYEELSARNPRLIYVSVSGFGQTGPLAERPGMDPVLQAFTGMIDANKGVDGIPHRVPFIPVDMTTALYGFQAIAASLYARRDETRGRHIDVNLLQSAAAVQTVRMMATYLEGGSMRPGRTPSGVFPTSDGWINITTLRESHFRTLCDALGAPELKDDPRFAEDDLRCSNEGELVVRLNAALAKRTSAEWSERLTRAGLLHEVVNRYEDFLRQPHTAALGAVAWLPQPGLERLVPVPNPPGLPPLEIGAPAARSPRLGENTAGVLEALGYTLDEIAGLAARRVIVLA